MASPQPGIFAEGSAHHYFLEYAVLPGISAEDLRKALGQLRRDLNDTSAQTSCVLAFGDRLWRNLSGNAAPVRLGSFEAMSGWNGHNVPATPGDLWIWFHGPNLDDNFDGMMAAQSALGSVAKTELDLVGFTYHNSQDLTGFIDGTANPKDDDRYEVALIPKGEAGAGGAYVLTQKWIHDLPAFQALPVPEQEKIIGRTKVENEELQGDAMPPDSHVARTDFTLEGVAQKIYRRSAPFGSAREQGLYFLAFAHDPNRFRVLLERMFGQNTLWPGDGLHDRLTEYSTPVTGATWFAPSLEDLDRIMG